MDFGFKKYDPCVSNKKINGKQCTILWHVDDMNIYYVGGEVLEELVNKVKASFGK